MGRQTEIRIMMLFLIACGLGTSACEQRDSTSEPSPAPLSLAPEPSPGTHYAASAWASVHRDSRNSDYAPLNPSADVRVAWTALEGAGLLTGPIIGPEGHLYVPSGRGVGTSHLHAFNRAGELLWETPIMRDLDDFDFAAVVSAPIVDDEGRVFAADSNQLWSFTPNGDLRWRVDLRALGIQGFFITPFFSRGGHVGGISTDGKLALFQREDGQLTYPILDLPGSSGPASQPAPPGLWQGGLIAREFVRPLWDLIYGREIEVANTPAVHPETGRIFITAAGRNETSGVLYGIDSGPEQIRIAFETPMGSGSGTSPAISPDGKLVYAIDDDGVMVAIDTTTGERIWERSDTMGQASPSIGPDGVIYSFNGLGGVLVAIEGETGRIKWSRQYNALAEEHLMWIPMLRRITTVDGLITVTDSGLFVFFDLNYEIRGGGQAYPQPRKVLVAQVDSSNGDLIHSFESRDTSGAFVVPDEGGRLYLTLSGSASSIAYYGVNPKLPFFLRVARKPEAGLVALVPRAKSSNR